MTRSGASGRGFDAKILVVSDTAAAGERVDLAGPQLRDRLASYGATVIELRVVPDGANSVAAALRELTDDFSGVVLTTGGTGFAPRDETPEGTALVLERDAPGLAEAMRAVNPLGRLSRSRAGLRGRSVIVNLPGSPRGALECLETVIDVFAHAVELLAGDSSPHPPDTGGKTAISSVSVTGASARAASPLTQT